ncbi:MAG: TRAP transporter large permease subunit [Gammaproteobacteria bacterium]
MRPAPLFLLVVNLCFLLAGMFIDPNSALLILVPPLFPVATALGIDPIHFGMVVTLNISLGMITPPFGLDIVVASSTLDKPVMTIIQGVWPFVVTNLLVLAVVTYVPGISLFIPRLLFG